MGEVSLNLPGGALQLCYAGGDIVGLRLPVVLPCASYRCALSATQICALAVLRGTVEQQFAHGSCVAPISHHRESDYKFDEQQMVANTGNTATYMQYSYARVSAIFRRGAVDLDALIENAQFAIPDPMERALALEILRLEEAVAETLQSYCAHHLTSYVYGLSNTLAKFYVQCKVLDDDPEVRQRRLLLCLLARRTIELVLRLLGIGVVESM